MLNRLFGFAGRVGIRGSAGVKAVRVSGRDIELVQHLGGVAVPGQLRLVGQQPFDQAIQYMPLTLGVMMLIQRFESLLRRLLGSETGPIVLAGTSRGSGHAQIMLGLSKPVSYPTWHGVVLAARSWCR
jgi:hypothetical protein